MRCTSCIAAWYNWSCSNGCRSLNSKSSGGFQLLLGQREVGEVVHDNILWDRILDLGDGGDVLGMLLKICSGHGSL